MESLLFLPADVSANDFRIGPRRTVPQPKKVVRRQKYVPLPPLPREQHQSVGRGPFVDTTNQTAIQASQEPDRAPFIDVLPPEVLTEIFLFVSFGDLPRANAPCIAPASGTGPLLLAQICASWRELAIGTPLLWSSIYIRNKPASPLVKLWIERSQELPFSFVWNFQHYKGDPNPPPSWRDEVFAHLVDAIHRWRRMSFPFIPDDIVKRIRTLSFPPSIALEELYMCYDSPSETLNDFDTSLFHALPWRFVTRFGWEANHLPLPLDHDFWSQLTDIQIGLGLTVSQCKTLLQFTNAKEIVLGCVFRMEMYQAPQPRIVLPALEIFVVEHAHEDATLFLDHLTCPSLCALHYDTGRSTADSWLRLTNFLKRSSCPIQELSVSYYIMPFDMVVEIVRTTALYHVPNFLLLIERLSEKQSSEMLSAIGSNKPHNFIFQETTMSARFGWVQQQIGWIGESKRSLITGSRF